MTNTQRKTKLIKLGRMIRTTEFGPKEKFYFAKILGFALFFWLLILGFVMVVILFYSLL